MLFCIRYFTLLWQTGCHSTFFLSCVKGQELGEFSSEHVDSVGRNDKIVMRCFIFILEKDAQMRAHPTYVKQPDCDTYVLLSRCNSLAARHVF